MPVPLVVNRANGTQGLSSFLQEVSTEFRVQTFHFTRVDLAVLVRDQRLSFACSSPCIRVPFCSIPTSSSTSPPPRHRYHFDTRLLPWIPRARTACCSRPASKSHSALARPANQHHPGSTCVFHSPPSDSSPQPLHALVQESLSSSDSSFCARHLRNAKEKNSSSSSTSRSHPDTKLPMNLIHSSKIPPPRRRLCRRRRLRIQHLYPPVPSMHDRHRNFQTLSRGF